MNAYYEDPMALALTLQLETFDVIGIDGKDGTGKSTLATTLGMILKAQVVHLDDYLIKNQDSYVSNIRYDELAHDLAGRSAKIVEGVCLLAVMKVIEIPVDFLIYVKYMRHGDWVDKKELVPRTNLDDHFRDLEEKTRTGERLIASMHNNPEPDLSNIVIPPLLKELIIYHQDFRPHEHANVEFHKIDSAND